MTTGASGSVERHWTILASAPPNSPTGIRALELPVDTSWGRIHLAIDAAGGRHLLIPVRSSAKVRTGLDGPGIRLHRRVLEDAHTYGTFADLSCLSRELHDLFDAFCDEVVAAIRDNRTNPLRAMYAVIDRWQSLFERSRTRLSGQQLTGLFGELIVLERLLSVDPGAHRLWLGPAGHKFDFASAGAAIEVKTSESAEGRLVHIHGLDQLDHVDNDTLVLVWLRVERAPSGASTSVAMQDLLRQVLELADDGQAIRELLEQVGFPESAWESYGDLRFLLHEQRWYPVNEQFPRLTRTALDSIGVPATVMDVQYTIDLSADPVVPFTDKAEVHHISRIVGGSR